MVFRVCLLSLIISAGWTQSYGQILNKTKDKQDKIQIALLLDISGSMDQLIFKAKSQFWTIANYVDQGRKKSKKAIVEFSVITYGGFFGTAGDYTTIVSNFTSDLDAIADSLYQIRITGSEELCWATINIALDKLTWSKEGGDLKLILIAGNESFEQGITDSKSVASKARKMGVIINTIYCSPKEDQISVQWREAAAMGKGSYFLMTLEDSLIMKENFMDKKLIEFNDKLNLTYVPFGVNGDTGFKKMISHDRNTKLSGIPLFRERAYYKAQESFVNPTWDMVDAYRSDTTLLTHITKEETPEDLRSMNSGEIKKAIEEKDYRRQSYKEAMRLRYEMITKYLGVPKSKTGLDSSVKEIVDKEGKRKGFVFK